MCSRRLDIDIESRFVGNMELMSVMKRMKMYVVLNAKIWPFKG